MDTIDVIGSTVPLIAVYNVQSKHDQVRTRLILEPATMCCRARRILNIHVATGGVHSADAMVCYACRAPDDVFSFRGVTVFISTNDVGMTRRGTKVRLVHNFFREQAYDTVRNSVLERHPNVLQAEVGLESLTSELAAECAAILGRNGWVRVDDDRWHRSERK